VAVTEPDFLRDTRASYDAIATVYAERFRDELAARPLDRGMLAGFAELVRANGAGPVADVGCGPGRVTGYLDAIMAISSLYLAGMAPSFRMRSRIAIYESTNCGSRCWSASSHGRRGGVPSIPANLTHVRIPSLQPPPS
jgi:hypothetical protein